MKFWKHISNAGLLSTDSLDYQKKIQLINRMCFLSAGVLIVFVPFIYIIGNTFYAPILVGFSILCSGYYFFSRARHFHFAMYWMLSVTIASILWGSIETPGSGVEYFAIPLSLMPFTVIDRKSFCIGFVALSAGIILLSHFWQKSYEPHFMVPPFFVEVTFVMVIVSVFAASALIISQFRIVNSKYENIIREQKLIVESKNKDIVDSINYARRIQHAKLPELSEITAALPHNFILFKPKDIVSGDFYFFQKNANGVFLAAGDCTGHGVPGALMTMIGSEKLEEAINQSALPSEILQQLNRKLKASLRQTDSDESTRDGMDIGLCLIDAEKRTVKFSGANRPLWIVRKDGTEVQEIRATKQSIGGRTPDDEQFELHLLEFLAGDTFYLATDGYADTFGGKESKKLTTKRFREILLSIREKSMSEQAEFLNRFIEEWKADTEQVDDILVIGVRF